VEPVTEERDALLTQQMVEKSFDPNGANPLAAHPAGVAVGLPQGVQGVYTGGLGYV